MPHEANEKQAVLLELFEHSGLSTKAKFGLRAIRDERLRGIGILGRGLIFSCFHQKHLDEASRLVELLVGAKTFDEFIDLCHQSRDFVNEALFVYSLSVAILHRPDCRGISLPPIQEIFPDKFVPVETIYNAFKAATRNMNKEEEIIVDVEATGNIKDPEYNLAYYREDVGINAHHWHWHVVYPSTWDSHLMKMKKDRKGELFFYMHQQMCARYDAERLSNGLPRMIPFHSFHEALEGYAPHLSSMQNGLPYASRPSGMALRDLHDVSVQDLERWRERILEAIKLRQVVDPNGNEYPLDETFGIDTLGAIIESSRDSKNKEFYGSLHNWGHVLMANIVDPDGKYQTNPGVMDDTATSLRDPIFYRWHRFIDDMFQELKKMLRPYTKDELGFTGVEIGEVTIKAHQDNVIGTSFEESLLEISNAFNFGRSGAVKVRYHHLDHEPFSYHIRVKNHSARLRHGTCRIFLSPAHDELHNKLNLEEMRRLMIELDRFRVELQPGVNEIHRNSKDSSVTISKQHNFHELLKGHGVNENANEYCSCGWPDHLLVPKGNDMGMDYFLFVMITDYLYDLVGDYGHNTPCIDAVSYCGAKDSLYPDIFIIHSCEVSCVYLFCIMASVPAGMESDSDSDDCVIVHNYSPSDKNNDSKIRSDKEKGFSDKRSTGGNLKPFANHLPNGNISGKSYQNAKNASARFNKRSSSGSRHQRRSLDQDTSQLYDDLRFAIMQGNLELAISFLDKGIPVDSILKAGWTCLMYACSCGHNEIVKYLLEKKADPNYMTDLFTPLMSACASSHDEKNLVKCVQLLVEYKAEVNVQERHLTTPLMFASREGHTEVVKKLLEHNADVDIHDNKGRTALHWAASYGYGQIVRLLLSKGADPHKVTFGGQSAADLAFDEGHKEVASLLQKGSLVSSIIDNADVEKEKNEMAVQEIKQLPVPKKSYMSPKEYNAFRKSLKPLGNTKCYVQQSDIDLFISGLGLSYLMPVLNEQDVAFSDLLIMTEEDLEKIGVDQFGARKKILEATKAVHKKEWETSSLPNLKQYQYISCPDAVVVVANIAQHLKYISSSITYVRQQIQAQPRILELGQDSSNVHDLIDETQESLKNVQVLNDELRFLKLHLDKVQDNVKYIPADVIVETVPKSKSRWKGMKIVVVLTLVTFTVGKILWKKQDFLSTLVPTALTEKIKFFKY